MTDKLANVAEAVGDYMDAILAYFKTGRKITVLVRSPEHADGSQDFLMTSDSIDEAVAALLRRKHDGQTGAV